MQYDFTSILDRRGWDAMAVDWVVRSIFFILRVKSGKSLKNGIEMKI